MYRIVILILLSSCSASWHVKKAIRKDPSIFKADTVTVIDTIKIVVPKVDTSFVYEFDTVEMIINDVKIRHHYDTLTNEVFIEADCPDSEVIIKTETVTNTVIIKPTFWDKIRESWWIALLILGLCLWLRLKN